MNEIHHLNLDGRLLQLLVILVETQSVTRTAERLDMTQSAVSHAVARLRRIVDDPLIVKSGRGIVATIRARSLAERARLLLADMQRFARAESFDPSQWRGELKIAANDLQRDLLMPALFERLRVQAPELCLRVVPSDVPSASMLRDENLAFAISPRPPDSGDIVHRRLFADRWRVFFDAGTRSPPRGLAQYLAAEHVSVAYSPPRPLEIDRVFAERGITRRIVAWVPNFAGIAPMLRGTSRLATLPGLLAHGMLAGLSHQPAPMACPLMPMYLIWHVRNRHDPAHRWLREQIDALVPIALAQARRRTKDPAPAVAPKLLRQPQKPA